jgi:hypothetical protein
MSGDEQTFVMMELARIKDEGRIEVIRERNANYHVFAFIDGQRPRDELITASLDQASVPPPETNHATKDLVKGKTKSGTTKKTMTTAKVRKPPAKAKTRKRR